MEQVVRERLSEAMSTYCLQEVWNDIQTEDRINLVPLRLTTRPATSSYQYQTTKIELPAVGGTYYIFAVTDIFPGSHIRYFVNKWTNCVDLCNKHNVLIHAYAKDGRMLQKGGVYFYTLPDLDVTLVAVEAAMWNRIMKDDTDLYLTRYFDSDSNDQIVTSYKLATQGNVRAAKNQAYNILSRYPYGLTIYIDGKVHTNPEDIVIDVGMYVDLIEDQDVVGEFTVDIAMGDYGYYSDRDSVDKLIIHVPKAINPNHRLITHNTCTFYIMRKKDGVGTYFHRLERHGVTQLTHMDFAIKETTLNAFVASASFANYSIRVQVRTHQKDNVLLTDANYIKYLYAEDDEKIVGHMRSQIDTNLSFWSAKELEHSTYVAMMLRMEEIKIIDEDFSFYLNAFGYYTTANLMCRHITSYKISDKFSGLYRVPKPYILYQKPVTPCLFLNGTKIRSDRISYQDNGDNTINVKFDKSKVYYKTGDRLDVAMITGETANYQSFTPVAGNFSITVPYERFSVFIKRTISEVTSFNQTYTTGFEEVVQSAGTVITVSNPDGSYTISFGGSLFDKELVIISDSYTTIFQKDLTEIIDSAHPLAIELSAYLNDEKIPLLGTKSTDVYLNGRYLVEGIDYFKLINKTDNNEIASIHVVLTNYEYCSDDLTNHVEIVANTTEMVAIRTGFTIDSRVGNTGHLVQWYDHISYVFVDGKFYHDIKEHPKFLETGNEHHNGLPYFIGSRIPRVVHDALVEEYPYNDLRLAAIDKYFGKKKEPESEMVVTYDRHHLYSPYLTQIFVDIKNGVLVAGYDPNRLAFLKQFDKYNYLRDADITLLPQNSDSGVDRGFVSIRAFYRDMGMSTMDLHRTMEKLISIYLIEEFK